MNAFFFDQQLGGGCCRSHRAAMGGEYCCPEFEFLNDAHLGGGVDGRHFQRLTYREEEDLSVTSYRQWEEDIADPNLKLQLARTSDCANVVAVNAKI